MSALFGATQPDISSNARVKLYPSLAVLQVANDTIFRAAGYEARTRPYTVASKGIVLNLALIPSWGASGAAAASLITQASTTILLPALIRPLRPNTKLMLDAVLFRGVLPEKQRNHTKE